MPTLNNATIWFAPDGYDPETKGINGRRVAGRSFLDGFFRHADVEKFYCTALDVADGKQFIELAKKSQRGLPAERVLQQNYKMIGDIGTLFYPGPTFSDLAWQRFQFGQSAYSLCGIAHTTATKRAMTGVFNLRTGPVEPWDALICTSHAQRATIETQLDQVDRYLTQRNGAPPPPRPMLPVIPLGIDVDAFDNPDADGIALRQKLNISPDTRVCMVMCRLSPFEKFDPLPMYQALALAQKSYGGDMALILCGYFANRTDETVFVRGARELMPDIPLHVVDGKDQAVKQAAFSAADIFLFPIDNLQETFGIAPLEAMAAGLPIIASDWDGLRDTITEDVGFRIPTVMAGPGLSSTESFLHLANIEGYQKFLGRISFKTAIDVPKMAEKIALLAGDPELTIKMGQAGRARARAHYDWSVVIPQIQDLWAEQNKMRVHAPQAQAHQYQNFLSPVAPPATKLFESYPTQSGLRPEDRFYTPLPDVETAHVTLKHCIGLRQFPNLPQNWKDMDQLLKVLVAAQGPITMIQLVKETQSRAKDIENLLILLMKYDIVRRA